MDEDDYVYTGSGKFPYQCIPKKVLKQIIKDIDKQ